MSAWHLFKAAFFPKPKIIVATYKRKQVDCSLKGEKHKQLVREMNEYNAMKNTTNGLKGSL